MKKIGKYIGKAVKKRKSKYLRKASKEFFEEAEDFFEDFFDLFSHKKLSHNLKQVNWYGSTRLVRPAYIFAQKVENFLKVVFGVSIMVSALLATFWGVTRTSELLTGLITSLPGRIFMLLIGFSYLMIGIWKLFNLPT